MLKVLSKTLFTGNYLKSADQSDYPNSSHVDSCIFGTQNVELQILQPYVNYLQFYQRLSPQGSPISESLYLLHSSALLKAIQDIVKVGHADDVLWMATASTPYDARAILKDQLHEAENWSSSHGMPLDISKTQYVLFTRHRKWTLVHFYGANVKQHHRL